MSIWKLKQTGLMRIDKCYLEILRDEIMPIQIQKHIKNFIF